MNKKTELQAMGNIIEFDKDIDEDDENFKMIMFIYKMAVKEVENKMEILKEEFKTFYDYDLIDHINTRVKSVKSIIDKMNKKGIKTTNKEMIKSINDIAGIRVICYMKDDIYSIRNLIENLPGVKIIKEKDYVKNPKKSGYESYHMIVEVPVTLLQKTIYVKVEIQIRTMAMDFWASVEHKMKYKTKEEVSKLTSKELVQCAKIVDKLDNKMMLLNN